jgi:integrase/recombinase XerD
LLQARNYSPRTVCSYSSELRFLFCYYPDIAPECLTQEQICNYIMYLRQVHQSGYTKIRMLAFSVKFLFNNILNRPYTLPSDLYPRREYKLPLVMTQDEVARLLDVTDNVKSRTILELYYSTGMRCDELRHLRIDDIDSANMRIRVTHGKGRRQRYVLLSPRVLALLRSYYMACRPQQWLFNGRKPGAQLSLRALQWIIRNAVKKAGINKEYSLHTLRHSFATHMLDQGNDLHTIKELLGHAKIETTMVYLHLQTQKRAALVSPIDTLMCPQYKPKLRHQQRKDHENRTGNH